MRLGGLNIGSTTKMTGTRVVSNIGSITKMTGANLKLGEIEIGSIFEWLGTDKYYGPYLKIHSHHDFKVEVEIGCLCIDLSTNTLCFFRPTDLIDLNVRLIRGVEK